jgi:hypothetical protein
MVIKERVTMSGRTRGDETGGRRTAASGCRLLLADPRAPVCLRVGAPEGGSRQPGYRTRRSRRRTRIFRSVISSMAYLAPSRPTPERLTPP